MKLTLIAEGSTKWQRFIRRWGVSYLIGDDIIFDTFGKAEVFLKNVSKLKIDLQKIKTVILSHDHWDHINGLKHIISANKNITVYIPEGFDEKTAGIISSYGVKVIRNNRFSQINGEVFLSESFPCKYGGRKLYEQAVTVKTQNGLTLISGCAHPGIDFIASQIKQYFKSDIDILIGGFHLKEKTDEENKKIINNLKEAGIKKIAPLHCTGEEAVKLIQKSFKNDFINLAEGSSLEL